MRSRISRGVFRLAVLPFAWVSRRGFLTEMGWFDSVSAHRSIDARGKPVPLWSYAFILFLCNRLHGALRVFEYGSGHSTLWLAERVQSLISIETSRSWYEKMRRRVPENVDLRHQELVRDGEYCRLAAQYAGELDIVIVDGFDRVRCAKHAVEALTPAGVIIFNDAHRETFSEAPAYLAQLGFRRLDFIGMGPQQEGKRCTTLFYRDHNCLGV